MKQVVSCFKSLFILKLKSTVRVHQDLRITRDAIIFVVCHSENPKTVQYLYLSIFSHIDWYSQERIIDGALLIHVRFADDRIIINDSPHKLQEMEE